MDPSQLVLRDVHLPPAPGWWPPAPGWWCVAAVVLAAVAIAMALRARRRGRLRRWRQWFDRHSAQGESARQVAAMSELLRRAARRVDAQADRLAGEDWLRFLDGADGQDFSTGPGRLLLEGGYRREVESAALEQLRALARARFMQLMAQSK